MRTGFEVILGASGKAKFHLFSPNQYPKESLVTFAQHSTTGIGAVLMGRLYYQDDLKAHFSQAFEQNFASDAALVLAIFEHYGAKGLEKLEGEFALVVFDPEKQCLLALRDPLGNYPLYWVDDRKTLRVSTNLRLLAHQICLARPSGCKAKSVPGRRR